MQVGNILVPWLSLSKHILPWRYRFHSKFDSLLNQHLESWNAYLLVRFLIPYIHLRKPAPRANRKAWDDIMLHLDRHASDGNWAAATWQIKFNLSSFDASQGAYELRMAIAQAEIAAVHVGNFGSLFSRLHSLSVIERSLRSHGLLKQLSSTCSPRPDYVPSSRNRTKFRLLAVHGLTMV